MITMLERGSLDLFFVLNYFFSEGVMYISGLRRSGTMIHSPTRRFTLGYQEVIRSGFLSYTSPYGGMVLLFPAGDS
jgi:hypothetical protein